MKICYLNVRHLSGEVASEWKELSDTEGEDRTKQFDNLEKIIKDIIPYNMKHNGETDACDLLMEINKLDYLHIFVEKSTFSRVCLYLTR